jgi:hypothetical protein
MINNDSDYQLFIKDLHAFNSSTIFCYLKNHFLINKSKSRLEKWLKML